MYRFMSWLIVLSLSNIFIGPAWGMSRSALKKSAKMMQKTCMPKNSVDLEMVGDIEKGTFIEDRNVMCYVACMYQMIGMVKNGKLDGPQSIRQVNTLFPPELKAPTIAAMDACASTTMKYKDLCESSYHTAVCMYNHDPPNFFFA